MVTDKYSCHIENLQSKKSISLLLVMVCIYIFLVIERPWESVRYLEGMPIERVYAILLILVAFMQRKLRVVTSPTNKWIYGLLAIHFALAPFAYNPADAVGQGIEYAKTVMLYLMMLSVVDDEDSLRLLVKVYVYTTLLYTLHSLLEYSNGRHVWRMGIARMVGVDRTFNDPNSFGATLVISFPIVYALLRSEVNKNLQRFYYIYFVLAVFCVVLTGSRTSFVAMLVLSAIWIMIQPGKRKLTMLAVAITAMAVVWTVMPEEKQNRFRTLWDEEAGPQNAKESADGRMLGWKVSWEMFKQNPLTGVGAGGKNFVGYRMLHHAEDGPQAANQAHVLYGEVLAEFGIMGAFLFLGLIISTVRCCTWARSRLMLAKAERSFTFNLAGAIVVTLILLLVFGIGGHNFYRPLWLWLAAWAGSLFFITSKKLPAIPRA